jgi:hypothetical protein
LTTPTYGRHYRHRSGYRYNPLVAFLPAYYASLAVPYALWYPDAGYTYLTPGMAASYNLPVLEEIPYHAPVEYINQRLAVLRATHAHMIARGYQIVPSFDRASGRGYFVWVSSPSVVSTPYY